MERAPKGRLADFLIGDLAPARRHIERVYARQLNAEQVIGEIAACINRCVRRIETEVRELEGVQANGEAKTRHQAAANSTAGSAAH